MADQESLENLIEGLAGAVVEAQRRIESHQIQNFLSYFDKHNRPKGIDIRLPSLHPHKGADAEDVQYHVPFLPLFASSLLRIRQVEISFDTDIAGLAEAEAEDEQLKESMAQDESGIIGAGKKKTVSLDIRGGVFGRKSGRAHVVLKVEGGELSEGMARLVDRLLQSQGEIE
jgi:hypothetical protein